MGTDKYVTKKVTVPKFVPVMEWKNGEFQQAFRGPRKGEYYEKDGEMHRWLIPSDSQFERRIFSREEETIEVAGMRAEQTDRYTVTFLRCIRELCHMSIDAASPGEAVDIAEASMRRTPAMARWEKSFEGPPQLWTWPAKEQ